MASCALLVTSPWTLHRLQECDEKRSWVLQHKLHVRDARGNCFYRMQAGVHASCVCCPRHNMRQSSASTLGSACASEHQCGCVQTLGHGWPAALPVHMARLHQLTSSAFGYLDLQLRADGNTILVGGAGCKAPTPHSVHSWASP